MGRHDSPVAIHRTVVEALTVDAMVLADEVESYFGGEELEFALPLMEPDAQAAIARVALKLATRLNRLVDWLVHHDARTEAPPEAVGSAAQLFSDEDGLELPPRARALAEATRTLFALVEGLHDHRRATRMESPARALQSRLAASLAR